MNQDIIAYYNARASEYEKVYHHPDEQEDLLTATALFQKIFAGKAVLEIACGTGYWTEQIAATAASIHATDINESMLQLARSRPISGEASFETADMYGLKTVKKYDGLFGGFIWSHILLQDLDAWIDQFQGLLKPGGDLVFIDSNPVEGTPHDSRRIAQSDEYGNTFQARALENGSTHLVLKNFPDEVFLQQKLSRIGTEIQVVFLKHYWIVHCRLSGD